MDGRWVSIDALWEDDDDPWADQMVAKYVAGEQTLAEEREARGIPHQDDRG